MRLLSAVLNMRNVVAETRSELGELDLGRNLADPRRVVLAMDTGLLIGLVVVKGLGVNGNDY